MFFSYFRIYHPTRALKLYGKVRRSPFSEHLHSSGPRTHPISSYNAVRWPSYPLIYEPCNSMKGHRLIIGRLTLRRMNKKKEYNQPKLVLQTDFKNLSLGCLCSKQMQFKNRTKYNLRVQSLQFSPLKIYENP